ncbi:MAG: hypothetical protein ABS44_00280 [Chryseobacterium sp. SCN 40-13]|nr:MAG: hypothetical protein ABS44_00280 [Chryseobacterium sp. SCN 40-13]OJV51442.1 MAG: hypothetical protein BGO31_09100 [Bacteroidetes bacterium 43-16]
MKKLKVIIITGASVVLMMSCFPKASKVIRALPVESKEQIKAQYTAAQLEEGHTIFTNSCGKCHKLKEPGLKTPEQWNKTVKRMIPRAKLNDDQGKLVRAYLIAHSKDS